MDIQSFKSFFYPILIKKYNSEINGFLELSLQNGKLVVDSPNANYSFGNLHKVFSKAIRQLQLNPQHSYNCLVLGFGAGSIAHILLNEFNLNVRVTGVEIDPVMIDIYEEHFKIHNKDLTIVHENAFDFIEKNTVKYDIILIDLFIDLELPSGVKDFHFLQRINASIHSKSMICMNVIGNDKQDLFALWTRIFKRKNYKKDYFDINTVFFSVSK